VKVSVIIPSFNAERFIAQTIGSVLAQTRPAHEIIVVDDGSSDGTADVVRDFGPEVRFVELEHGGATRTRNRGAALTNGDALLFLDADDVLGPDVLRHLVAALRGAPQGIALAPWYRLEQVGGRWVRRPPSCAPCMLGDDVLQAWLCGWYHPPCAVLWSRPAYELSGGWDEELTGNPNDDGDVVMRALARGARAVSTRRGAAFYRRHDAPTLSGRRFTEQGLQARMRVLENLAGVLRTEGRLGSYRLHIGAAFDLIGTDCRDQPTLSSPHGMEDRHGGGGSAPASGTFVLVREKSAACSWTRGVRCGGGGNDEIP
jgi:glycosyltransferase involved in cell wall biosynthesis